MARKPLVGTVAANVLAHGTGALNIDGCRVEFAGAADEHEAKGKNRHADFGSGPRDNKVFGEDLRSRGEHGNYDPPGRWPANVVLSHSEDCRQVGAREVASNGHHPAARGPSGYGSNVEGSNGGGLRGHDGLDERHTRGEVVESWECSPGCPVRMLDEQTGDMHTPGRTSSRGRAGMYGPDGHGQSITLYGDAGGASRFFYTAKASRAERNAGLDDGRNAHPTVKPIDLMRWLVRLVTPPGGTVLDPFVGSGTTGCAAALEGFDFIGIERDVEYARIAEARTAFWREHPTGLPVDAALEADTRRRETRAAGQMGLL